MRWTIWTAVILFAAAPAWAGKKGKKKKSDPSGAPVEQVQPAPAADGAPEAPPEFIEVGCGFAPGTSVAYTQSSETVQDKGEGPSRRAFSGRATFSVQAFDDGVAELVYDARVEEHHIDDPVMAAVMEAAGDEQEIPVQLKADFTEMAFTIVNQDALMEMNARIGDLVIAEMAKASGPLPPQVEQGMREMMANPQIAEQDVLKYVAPTLMAACGAVPTEATYTSQSPNPFGGPPIPLSGTMTAEVLDDGTVRIQTLESVPEEAARAAVLAFARQMMPADAQVGQEQVEQAIGGLALDIQLTQTQIIDPETGWAVRWEQARQTVAGPGTRTDRLEMTRVD
jgi:hypothetical protein